MKLKIWELALFSALVVAVLWSFLLDQRQQNLSEQLIRLHVVPHSNEDIDQTLKFAVRDSIQSHLRLELSYATDANDAARILSEQLDSVQDIAEQVAADFGRTIPVTVSLGQARFPTRAYGHFTLPAGNYAALQIHLGDASGQNWWCVVFPPLCFDAATSQRPDLVAMGFLEEEIALIADTGGGVALRFRTLELLDRFRG